MIEESFIKEFRYKTWLQLSLKRRKSISEGRMEYKGAQSGKQKIDCLQQRVNLNDWKDKRQKGANSAWLLLSADLRLLTNQKWNVSRTVRKT